MRFNLNDLKVLEHLKICFRECEKRTFWPKINLGTFYPFRLKNGQNAEIGHANHILPRRFQGAFWYNAMDLLNPTEIPLNSINYGKESKL